MTALTDDTLTATPHAMRDEMIVFALMAVVLAAVPFTSNVSTLLPPWIVTLSVPV